MSEKINKSDVLENMLDPKEVAKISSMVENYNKNKTMELEVSFRNINYSNYMRICEHYVNVVDEENISAAKSLDISILADNGNNYRVSLLDVEEIESFLDKYANERKSTIIDHLLSLSATTNGNYEIIMKDRGSADKLFIEDLDIFIKNTTEVPVTKSTPKPKNEASTKVLYRYKNRYSFKIGNNVRLDITDVQESPNIREIATKIPKYEIEMEVINRKIQTQSLFDEMIAVLSIIQDSQIPIRKTEKAMVIKEYKTILSSKSQYLESRNVISIEPQHIINFIPNKYGVTDKADGERYFLVSIEKGVYLLSTNMVVKKLNVHVGDKKYHNMILDGEYVRNENGQMYLAFDVVYAGAIDYRFGDRYKLTDRLNVLTEIIDGCFGNLVPFTDYTDNHDDIDLEKIKSFLNVEIKKYWKLFREKLSKYKHGELFITKKKYFIPYGVNKSEIFLYADLVWKLSNYESLPPYKLDGIIYTPINSSYMIKVNFDELDKFPLEYKWKSPQQNSIDFYITINKNNNGEEAIFYDELVADGLGNPYKICKLFVGVNVGGKEKPIPFKVNGMEQTCNIYLIDDEARDIEGNIINDNTVVEFIYDSSKEDISDTFKWVPLKTRYDKTEAVQKYNIKYGNNLNIARRIWKTIINPITEDDIMALGNPGTFNKEIAKFNKMITPGGEDLYYESSGGIKTNKATGMRSFNNWIKSNMILTYCKNKNSVLDIGCGRGGDLIKFVNSRIKEYVGVDIDYNGLYTINDSAFNRYKKLKRTTKNMPNMHFINANACGLFNSKSQETLLPQMQPNNKRMIDEFLNGKKKYDVINCQFTLHYYLSDKVAWSNFCTNLNDHMSDDGYLLITCFDGKLIYDKLVGKQKLNVSYTDNNGNKNTFFEINKIYTDLPATDDSTAAGASTSGANESMIGMGIDVHNSIISRPGKYIREYLVFPEFLKQSLMEKVGLELVESESFFNIFNLYTDYFTLDNNIAKTEMSNKKYDEIKAFYEILHSTDTSHEKDAVDASFKFTMLNKFYVFKKAKKDIMVPARIVGVNHKINLGKYISPHLSNNSMIIDPSKKTKDINKIYRGIVNKYKVKPSIYLVRHKIINNDLIGQQYSNNKFEFLKIKGGNSDSLLIYKSPEKIFYPIYHQNYNYDEINDDASLNLRRVTASNKAEITYLIKSPKIIEDLNFVVNLTGKFS